MRKSIEDDLPDAAAALTQVMPTTAPPLRFTDATGRQLTLQDYLGHALVVNLWATWCGPCIAEIPSFAALAPRVKASGALILPISIDLTGAAVVRPFFARHGISDLPILLNQDGSNMQVLGSNGIPVSVVIDPQGRLVARLDGAANWNTPATDDLFAQPGRPGADRRSGRECPRLTAGPGALSPTPPAGPE